MQLQRSLSILFGLAAIALAAVVAMKSAPPLPVAHAPSDAGEGGASAADATPTSASAGTGAPSTASDAVPEAGIVLASDLTAADEPSRGSGGPGAALPSGAPRQVRLGVILVQYEGAQGASGKSRTKADATALAQKLAEEAKTNFAGAVQHGDPGSSGDVGRMQRGVLEPQTEIVLFSLAPGAVSDPIDTPRGFWIAKRIE